MLDIPISQTGAWFSFSTELEAKQLGFVFRWNDRSGRWFFDLFDADGAPIASGIAVSTNWPLIAHLHHLPAAPKGELLVIDTAVGDPIDPTFDSLGRRHLMKYLTEEETELSGIDPLRFGAV